MCPQCSDPWCSCDCALCVFVCDSADADVARSRFILKGGDTVTLLGADRSCLDGRRLRMDYYQALIERMNPDE